MQIIKKYDFNYRQVSSIVHDDTYPGYVWVAFESQIVGECRLIKASTFNLNQRTFTLTVPVDRINKVIIDSSFAVLAVEDNTLIGYKYSRTTPFSTFLALSKPVGVNEAPIDIVASNTNYYYLLPGIITGENAKIVKTDKSGSLVEIIDLSKIGDTITDAASLAIDINEDLWVVTNTSPVKLVRVFDDGGYDFQTHNII